MKTLLPMLAALVLAAAAPAGSGPDADAYRVRIAVSPGAGSTVQRLVIPAAALAAAQTPDTSDLRVFDARGRAMPIARAPVAAPALRRDVLSAMPILGAADALQVRGVSLRVDADGRARVARVDGTIAQSAGRSAVLGALFDARAATGAARALVLDADVPEGQPVTFAVEASRDLSSWRVLGEKVVYRAPAAPSAGTTVPLSMAPVAGEYLKVTWRLASRPLSPVRVRRAALITRAGGPAAEVHADASPPPLTDAHAIAFALPFRTPVATLRIVPAGDDVIVPVRILGRDDAEQPWTPVGEGVAARPTAGGEAAAIALSGAFRTLRIEADARTPGFTAAPALRLGFARRELLFLAAGSAPFTLAVGRTGMPDVYLPAESLMTQAGGAPAAIARAAPASARVALAHPGDARAQGRRWLLWVMLLLATAVLAALAWVLFQRGSGSDADESPSSVPADSRHRSSR
jgi:hypothetical protein